MDQDRPSDETLAELRREVARFPTDLRRRYHLGVALSQCQEHEEALSELQKAMLNPHVRLPAMRMLVESLDATNRFELAAALRERIAREFGSGDDSAAPPPPAR